MLWHADVHIASQRHGILSSSFQNNTTASQSDGLGTGVRNGWVR